MIRIFQSHNYPNLATALAATMEECKDVFAPHFVVADHHASQQWLREFVANTNGIVAHLHAKTLDGFWDMIHNVLEAGPTKAEMLRQEQLAWIIDGILASDSFQNNLDAKAVKDYAEGDAMKRFGLAEKLADLFTRYQLLDPNILEGDADSDKPGIAWQRLVWKNVKEQAGDKIPDRHAVFQRIRKALHNPDKLEVLRKKVPYVYFFGTQWWTPAQATLLQKLAEHIRISIFQLHIPYSEHPLFEYLGDFQRKQANLFGEAIPVFLDEEPYYITDKLLGKLQLDLRNFPAQYQADAANDDSLTVSAHYGTFRETEALYHYVVQQLAADESLKPRDICVILPDVTRYATAISTYFRNDKFPIPYTIFDTAQEADAAPWEALTALLQLDDSFSDTGEVFDLLRFAHISRRFGITDLGMLREALEKANILKGYENDGQTAGLVSWQYGLKRLIYGFCMSPQAHRMTQGTDEFYTIPDYEESRQMNELLRLHLFSEKLNHWLKARNEERSLMEWVKFLQEETLDTLLHLHDREDADFSRILSDIVQLSELELFKDYKVPYLVMRHYLNSRLQGMEAGSMSGFGGVRFISPHYTLSASAKIYAFLGLNSEDFPRRSFRPGFDLLGEEQVQEPDLDKHLLLNVLLSAEQKCYFSYQSYELSDNVPKPFSAFIAVLLNSMAANVPAESPEALMVAHPLYGLDGRYNKEKGLVRYGAAPRVEPDRAWLKKAPDQEKEEKEEKEKVVIDLDDMINYFKDPVKYYYEKVLKIYLKTEEKVFNTDKIFERNNLEKWIVKDEILKKFQQLDKDDIQAVLKAKDPTDFEQKVKEELKLRGMIPLGQFGEDVFKDAYDKTKKMYNKIYEKVKDWTLLPPKEISYQTDNWTIQGKIDGLYRDGDGGLHYVFHTVSKISSKYQFEAVAKYRLLNTVEEATFYFFSVGPPVIAPVLQDTNPGLLDGMVGYYLDRTSGILRFTLEHFGDIKEKHLNGAKSLHGFFQNLRQPYYSEAFKRELDKGTLLKAQNFEKFLELYQFIKPNINFKTQTYPKNGN